MIITLVAFFAVLVVVIIAHELGHFVTAKAFGVKVEEFGLGYPPRLLSVRRGETIYSLNAIPVGGFVKMAGEEDPKVRNSLASKGIGTRLLVLSAGSLMNFLLPLLLFSIAFIIPHNQLIGQVLIKEVSPNSPAAMAGIESDDVVLRINGHQVRNIGDVNRYLQLNLGKEVTILVEHDNSTTESVQAIPRWKPPEGQGAIGVLINMTNTTIVRQHYPFWEAIPMGVVECIETFGLFKNAIISMFVGTMPLEVAGPVGIAQITGEVARTGFSSLLQFAAFLSINLAIINLFPLPALDGGRIMFVWLECIRRGRRIPPRIEGMIHYIGYVMLLGAIMLVTYKDIMRIVSGESLIP
ncbi:RIP metalloprotease [Chloroflexota bacterium]